MQTVCFPFGHNRTAVTISTDMLATFVKVAEGLSVSRAADELGVGKSVVSKRVAQLEEALQSTLFSRSTRKIVLTPAGEAYLDCARRAIAEMSAGEERLRSLRTDLTGRIRLTAPVSWGQRVLAKRVPEFLRQHPAIEIDLQLADRKMDLAFERIDIALRWSAETPASFSSVTVAAITWALAASPAYLAARTAPRVPADLERHDCLCYWREHADDAWTLARGKQAVAVRARSRYHVDNPEAVADAALHGLGIAMLPGYLCDDALADGRLVRVLPGWLPQTRFGTQITAVATPERMRIVRNQAFLAFLREPAGT